MKLIGNIHYKYIFMYSFRKIIIYINIYISICIYLCIHTILCVCLYIQKIRLTCEGNRFQFATLNEESFYYLFCQGNMFCFCYLCYFFSTGRFVTLREKDFFGCNWMWSCEEFSLYFVNKRISVWFFNFKTFIWLLNEYV